MITIIYRAIVVIAIVFVAAELLTQKKAKLKVNAALILIPLLLRAFMVA